MKGFVQEVKNEGSRIEVRLTLQVDSCENHGLPKLIHIGALKVDWSEES